MPRLILHAGWHKTATSAIQAFARTNRDELRRRDIWYPDLGAGQSHHRFAHAVANATKHMTVEEARGRAGQWAQAAAASGETVFLSAEAICRHVDQSTGEWLERRRGYLQRLAAVLAGFDISVVLVVRRQDDFIKSLFQEFVMKGRKVGALPFPEFRDRFRNRTRFLENLAVFEEVFSKVTVLVYEDLPKNDGFCGKFFEAIGVDAGGLNPVGVVRKSLSPGETVVKQFFNPIKSAAHNREVLDWLRGEQVQQLLGKYYDGENLDVWESLEARTRFLAGFDAENEALRARYFPGRERLFPPLPPTGHARTVVLPPALQAELLKLLGPGQGISVRLRKAVRHRKKRAARITRGRRK